MNMTDIVNYCFDKPAAMSAALISRNNKRNCMIYLESLGSKEPILLMNIIQLVNLFSKNISKKIIENSIINYLLYNNNHLTEKIIKHELTILKKLNIKYQNNNILIS